MRSHDKIGFQQVYCYTNQWRMHFNFQSYTIFPLLHNCSTRGNANIWYLFWFLSCFLWLKNGVFLPGFIFDFPVNVWLQKFVPSLKWHFWFQMLTEYRANGTEEAKKKRWKPGMQSPGGRDIPAPPVLYVFKRFLSCREWESHFVILLSNQNGWSSTKMQLVR